MSEYRCSQCGETHSCEDYNQLDRVSRVTDDPNDEYGVETVCECGARFHSDKWQLVTETKHENGEFKVSTAALTIAHGPNHNHWYETCVFFDTGSSVVERYETQEEAEEGHGKVVGKIRAGAYTLEATSHMLSLCEK